MATVRDLIDAADARRIARVRYERLIGGEPTEILAASETYTEIDSELLEMWDRLKSCPLGTHWKFQYELGARSPQLLYRKSRFHDFRVVSKSYEAWPEQARIPEEGLEHATELLDTVF